MKAFHAHFGNRHVIVLRPAAHSCPESKDNHIVHVAHNSAWKEQLAVPHLKQARIVLAI